MKKLFIVTVEFEFAALAEDDAEALDLVTEAEGNLILSDHATTHEVTSSSRLKYPSMWGKTDLVYHNGKKDITLGDALAAVDGAGKGGKS